MLNMIGKTNNCWGARKLDDLSIITKFGLPMPEGGRP
jgi:hypothetical protein